MPTETTIDCVIVGIGVCALARINSSQTQKYFNQVKNTESMRLLTAYAVSRMPLLHCTRRRERESDHIFRRCYRSIPFCVCICIVESEVCRRTSAMKIRLDNIMRHTINSGE